MLKTYKNKSTRNVLAPIWILFIFIYIATFLSITPESQTRKRKYQKNLKRVEEFKRNMSKKEKEYYEPRKKFIDKQSVKPSDTLFYQIDIILRGTALREKNIRNIREIRKLENLLLKADDFQLHRYFGQNEELYLSMKASKAFEHIKKEANSDENWRRKNDPIFNNYLKYQSTRKEKNFYKKNKALFFKTESGRELIQFLKIEAHVKN